MNNGYIWWTESRFNKFWTQNSYHRHHRLFWRRRGRRWLGRQPRRGRWWLQGFSQIHLMNNWNRSPTEEQSKAELNLLVVCDVSEWVYIQRTECSSFVQSRLVKGLKLHEKGRKKAERYTTHNGIPEISYPCFKFQWYKAGSFWIHFVIFTATLLTPRKRIHIKVLAKSSEQKWREEKFFWGFLLFCYTPLWLAPN